MKNIEEIREKLGPDYRVEENDGVITVCSIWDGVEFAEFKGSVFKIDENGWAISKYDCNPSTESAYVEQLKAKAKELYGEIKDGDRFKGEGFENKYVSFIGHDLGRGFIYQKCSDTLHLNHLLIYKQGKWANKIEEMVKVEVEDWKATTNAEFKSFDFIVKMRVESSRPFDPNESAVYLAKCLEEYLNKS